MQDKPAITRAGRREHFVPLTKAALARRLGGAISDDSARRAFEQFCRLLEATLHYEFHERLEKLCRAYHAFNPDTDKLRGASVASIKHDQTADEFFHHLGELLEHAHFYRLSREQVEETIAAAQARGILLRVDFDLFQRLEVFARGDTIDRQQKRRWRFWGRLAEVEIPVYRRLLVAFRPRPEKAIGPQLPEDAIYLKLFKNIPHDDLQMLMPGGRVAITWWDRARILTPTITGLAITGYKISKGALLLAFAGVYGMLAFLGLVGGTIGYGLRSFYGYLQAKDKYRLHLTENLYFQNLDNNAGVLFRLLYEAEEQEFCEAALAYFLLWQQAGDQPWSLEQLDREAEAMLAGYDCGQVDFEASDALAKLQRWGLIHPAEDGRFQASPIEAALARLDRAWDGYFRHSESLG